MKRIMFVIGMFVVAFLSAFPLAGQTTKVSQQTAEQVARTFWNLHHDRNAAELCTPMHRLDMRWDAFYIFAPAEGKGFVIVAADDRVRPVLAYSFHNNAMRDTMAPGMNWWLEGWQQQVDALRKEKGGERNEEWQRLLADDGIPRMLTVVDPLITTQWGQDVPYNDSCPDGVELGLPVRALTGCVATAMAQVMKYWNYPERGTGSHTYYSSDMIGMNNHQFGEQTANFGATVYDWDNMPNSLTSASPDVQKAAVATLMYHCGVACDMHYGSHEYGSGAKTLNIPYLRRGSALNGMIKYLGYSSSATGIKRIKYDDNVWTALVRGELDASRPIIYVGYKQDSGGHCFVCDGYDDENRYHFNWGWRGNGDGFYTLDNLSPSNNYTRDQQILVGIQPPVDDDSLCIIRHFPYTEDFETAPTCWEATASSILCSYSWLVVDSEGVDGNYSAEIAKSRIDSTSVDRLFSPAIVTPGDYKVTWQVRAETSLSDSYTLTVDNVTFSDMVDSDEWQSREVFFSVAEGDTIRLDFSHISNYSSGGLLIDNIVIEQVSDDYTITVSANPSNGGTVTGGGTYQQGQSCTITATPAAGYTFVRWTENGTQVSTNAHYNFIVTSNRTLVAQFQQQTYAVSVSANPSDGGSVTGGGTYNHGATCSVTATANEGYTFTNWTENGNVVSNDATYSFTVTGGRVLVANFDMLMVEIGATVDPEEAASIIGTGTYTYGDQVTLALDRNEDWAFLNWTEDGEMVSEEMTYTFVATQSRDLVAHFVYTEGIGEQTAHSLIIYPNPVDDKLTIEAQKAIGTVEIYNLMGALVYSQKNCGNKVEINTADMQSGIYFIHLMNDKVSETRKFVKE